MGSRIAVEKAITFPFPFLVVGNSSKSQILLGGWSKRGLGKGSFEGRFWGA
jgi:hypothetical protein